MNNSLFVVLGIGSLGWAGYMLYQQNLPSAFMGLFAAVVFGGLAVLNFLLDNIPHK